MIHRPAGPALQPTVSRIQNAPPTPSVDFASAGDDDEELFDDLVVEELHWQSASLEFFDLAGLCVRGAQNAAVVRLFDLIELHHSDADVCGATRNDARLRKAKPGGDDRPTAQAARRVYDSTAAWFSRFCSLPPERSA